MTFSIQTLLIPCGGTALVILIYVWLAWYVFHASAAVAAAAAAAAGNSFANNESSKSRTRHGLSKDDIQKLPTFICSCHHHEKDEERDGGDNNSIEKEKIGHHEELCVSDDLECCVCLEEFKDGDRCLLMPSCKHCFHVDCADAWLSKRPICPLCRAAALPKEQGSISNDPISESTVLDVPALPVDEEQTSISGDPVSDSTVLDVPDTVVDIPVADSTVLDIPS